MPAAPGPPPRTEADRLFTVLAAGDHAKTPMQASFRGACVSNRVNRGGARSQVDGVPASGSSAPASSSGHLTWGADTVDAPPRGVEP